MKGLKDGKMRTQDVSSNALCRHRKDSYDYYVRSSLILIDILGAEVDQADREGEFGNMYRIQTGMSFSLPLPGPKKILPPPDTSLLPVESMGPAWRSESLAKSGVRQPGVALELDSPALESNSYEILKL